MRVGRALEPNTHRYTIDQAIALIERELGGVVVTEARLRAEVQTTPVMLAARRAHPSRPHHHHHSGHYACVNRARVGTPQRATARQTTAVLLAVLLGIGLVAAITSRRVGTSSVPASERQLREGFLEPMSRSGVGFEVLDACHYDRPTPEYAWHLAVKIAAAAPIQDVAEALQRADVVVREERILQQFRGQPNKGWDGGIESRGDQTIISLVKNNVHTNDRSIGVAWLPICPESRVPAHS